MITRKSSPLTVGCALLWSALANAQSTYTPPPLRPSVDANGVNLATGIPQFSKTDIAIGQPGAGGLTFTRTNSNGNANHEYVGFVTKVGDDTVTKSATVVIGGYTEDFTKADN